MKLWVDDGVAAPEGWKRARSLTEAEAALRGGKVRELSLGGSGLLVETVAQALEQGAFTARLRPLSVVLRGEHPTAARALDNAGRHWAAMPPPAPPAKRKKRSMLLRFAVWHILGFAVVFAAFEAWNQWRHHRHADVITRILGHD
jgi:hypothetical protein